jgi:hypothetical protein
MDHPLDDSYLKVRRAQRQVETLYAEMLTFGRENPLQMSLGLASNGEMIARIPEPPRWPPEWAVVAGEIAHNLRSALDYAVFQLARSPEQGRTSFPISPSKKRYLKTRAQGKRKKSYRDASLDGVDPKWATWIDRLQPFESPNPNASAQELLILSDLSNRDKHRVRHSVLSVIEVPFAFVTVDDTSVVKNLELKWNPHSNKINVNLEVRGQKRKGNRLIWGIDPKPTPDGARGVDIVFGGNRYRINHLGTVARFVEFVLDSLCPAFV